MMGKRMAMDDQTGHPGGGASQRPIVRGSGAVRRLPLRGRTAHVVLIDGLLTQAAEGDGPVLIIEGPPGIGKTRLADEVAARASRVGARPLWGRAYEDQQTVSFGPLLEAIVRSEPPICDAKLLKDLSQTAATRFWAVRNLQTAIAEAAAITPLSISIDDFHWADAGTTMAVQTLISGLARAPVLWTLTLRSAGGRPEVRGVIAAIVAERGDAVHHVHLGAVGKDGVVQIAADVLGAGVDPSVIQYAGLAHGNPFLVLETLRGLDEENRIDVTGGRARITGRGLPRRLGATMQHRLDRLSPGARRTIQVASVLPERFSAALLARALDLAPAQMFAGVEESIRADLLTEIGDHLGFRHDLLRRAAQQTLPEPLRRAMERESARLLLEMGAAPEEVAIQLARSAETGDVVAVSSLRQAARTLSTSDPSGAADLSRRAVDLLRPDDGLRATVVGETVFLLNNASRFSEAQLLATSTLDSEVPAEEEAQIRLSLSMASAHWPARRAEQNRQALQLDGMSAVTRARHLGWLAYNLTNDGRVDDGSIAARTALRAADETEDLHTRLMAESSLLTIECTQGHEQRCARRVAESYRTLWTAEAGVIGMVAAATQISVLIALGRLKDAEDAIAEALEHCRRQHNTAGERVFTNRQALCDFAAGRLVSARDTILASVPVAEGLRQDLVGGRSGVMILGAIAAHTDDYALIEQVGIAARQAFDGGPAVRRESMTTLAYAAWQRGDTAEAARWLGEDVALLTTPTWPMDLDYVILAARVARSSSDAGLRQRVVAAADVLERGGPGSTLYCAVALHARGLLEDDLGALEAAATGLAASSRPLLHAGAAEDLGVALNDADDRDHATQRWSEAFEVYSAHGATADARRTARRLNVLGVQRRIVRVRAQSGWESLTNSELRVSELVANGATNRQAAAELGVSPHTINTQLRSVFSKLGIHSRAELIRAARAGCF
jgi:DNA-binding CsgD family transcriptional regulator